MQLCHTSSNTGNTTVTYQLPTYTYLDLASTMFTKHSRLCLVFLANPSIEITN